MRYFPGRGPVEGEPKTASSKRKIVLSPFLVDVLKQHRVHQLEARLQAGKTWEDHDLVFCNTIGGFISPATLFDTFQKFLRDADLPHMRFHDLRHSAATLLLAKGVHIKVVLLPIQGNRILSSENNAKGVFTPSSFDEKEPAGEKVLRPYAGGTLLGREVRPCCS